jgi:hypothetical protein
MGNSPNSTKDPCPKFSWIDTGIVCAEDLEIVWNHFSHNKIILKEDVAAFVAQVVKVRVVNLFVSITHSKAIQTEKEWRAFIGRSPYHGQHEGYDDVAALR